MKTSRVRTLVVAVFAGLMLRAACGAEAGAPAASNDGGPPEEFIVTAKALQDLRLKIRLAEEEVYARFNAINSDDSHDIHCYERPSTGSHATKRLCVSNAWRAADANVADAIVRGIQSTSGDPPGGSYGSIPAKFRANQLRAERLVMQELGDLANDDPALHDAMMRAAQAYQALETATGSRAEWTVYQDMPAGDDGLPFGAKHLVVRIGEVAWNHPLTSHTFTIGSVTGRIRGLRVRCGKLDKKLDYQEEVDWTLPDSWGDCMLAVSAKRGTTFALYEF